jgi:hypothetical protein
MNPIIFTDTLREIASKSPRHSAPLIHRRAFCLASKATHFEIRSSVRPLWFRSIVAEETANERKLRT